MDGDAFDRLFSKLWRDGEVYWILLCMAEGLSVLVSVVLSVTGDSLELDWCVECVVSVFWRWSGGENVCFWDFWEEVLCRWWVWWW